jgi:hypothetical protein
VESGRPHPAHPPRHRPRAHARCARHRANAPSRRLRPSAARAPRAQPRSARARALPTPAGARAANPRRARALAAFRPTAAWLRAHRAVDLPALRQLLAPQVTLTSEEPAPAGAPVAAHGGRPWEAHAAGHVGAKARDAARALAEARAAEVRVGSPTRGRDQVADELARLLARCAPPGGRVRALGAVEQVDVGISLGARAKTVVLHSHTPPLVLDPDSTGGPIRMWLLEGSLADPHGAPPVLAFATDARIA